MKLEDLDLNQGVNINLQIVDGMIYMTIQEKVDDIISTRALSVQIRDEDKDRCALFNELLVVAGTTIKEASLEFESFCAMAFLQRMSEK